MKVRGVLVGAFIVLFACGGSGPSSPSKNLNLAGTWTGSWQFVTSGVTITDAVTATLTQSGTDVNGTWTAQSGASGQFTHLTATASISGGLTITQPTVTGTSCSATSTVSGTASASTIDLTAATIASNGLCQWATGQKFSLHK